jgi:hypothetical protein
MANPESESGGFTPQQKTKEGKPRYIIKGEKGKELGVFPEDAKKFDKMFKNQEERRKEERAKKLEIPEDVKPGSADMVWYKLRNTIINNEEAAQKAREEGKPDEKREALVKKQKMQQKIFDSAKESFSKDLIFKGSTAEQADEKASSLTASEMSDLVEEHVVEHLEQQLDEGEKHAKLKGQVDRSAYGYVNVYPIDELLKATEDLQYVLNSESSESGNE